MPICLLIHPSSELFGADRMFLESTKAVVEAGNDCFVALPEDGPLVAELEAAGATTFVIPMLVLRKALLRPKNWCALIAGSWRGFLAAWQLITRVKPDSLYVSTITLPQWPLVGRLRRLLVTTHVHEAEGSASRWVNLALYLPQLPASRVLVNSEFSLKTIERSLPRLARGAEVVLNGVTGPPAEPSPPRVTLEGGLRILYLGRLSPRKGPDLVIEAARRLQDQGAATRIVLAGSTFEGYEWYEEELRTAVRNAGFLEDGVLVGFQRNIWPLLENCDVLVVPSRLDEPFGNTAVEGVLAHRPVIVSDTTGLREAAAGYPSAQLIERNNVEALTTSLQKLIDNWDEMNSQVGYSAVLAGERHAPATYRQRISDAIT